MLDGQLTFDTSSDSGEGHQLHTMGERDRDMLDSIKKHGCNLQFVTKSMQDDKEVVLMAVSDCSHALEFASNRLRADEEVVWEAVRTDGIGLCFASLSLRNNRRLVLVAVSSYGLALQYASPLLCADKEVVNAAVLSDGGALEFAAVHLQDDIDIVLSAVSNSGRALQFVSAPLLGNRDVLLAAVYRYPWALHAAPDLLLVQDPTFLAEAAVINADSLMYATNETSDKEFMTFVVSRNGIALEYVSSELVYDKELALAAVSNDGMALRYASTFCDDRDVVNAALCQNGESLRFASDRLRADKQIAIAALKQSPSSLAHVHPSICDTIEIRLVAAVEDKHALLVSVGEQVQDLLSGVSIDTHTLNKRLHDDITDALSFFAANNNAFSNEAEKIVSEIHSPTRQLFSVFHKRSYQDAFCHMEFTPPLDKEAD
jgi:hypothetical protein